VPLADEWLKHMLILRTSAAVFVDAGANVAVRRSYVHRSALRHSSCRVSFLAAIADVAADHVATAF